MQKGRALVLLSIALAVCLSSGPMRARLQLAAALVQPPVQAMVGQLPDNWRQRMELAQKSTEPSDEELLALRTDRIDRALQSPELLWEFVTRPEPFYLERRAAARQGALPPEWLPKIWAAIGEVQRQHSTFGIAVHPLSVAPRFPWERPAPGRILGHLWNPPIQLIDFPLTPEELERAPWPWQVAVAFGDLRAAISRGVPGAQPLAPAEAYFGAVLGMPCRTDEEAVVFIEAATQFAGRFAPIVMGALRNIALNPALPVAALRASGVYVDQRWDDARAYWVGYAGILDILRRSPHPGAREGAARSVRDLRVFSRSGEIYPQPVPAAVILEMGDRALATETGTDVGDLYALVFHIAAAVDEPPFPVQSGPSSDALEVTRSLRAFREWYAVHRGDFVKLAEQQKPGLAGAGRLLDRSECK